MEMVAPTQQAEVVAVRTLCPSVRELTLQPLQGRVSFRPGQWISLHLPVGQRPPLVRAYSLAEPEIPDGRLVLVLDRVAGGLGSGHLFTLKERDTVLLVGPYGKFCVPEPCTQDLVMVARFTGIVPVRCILRDFLRQEPSRLVKLIYSAHRQDEMIWHEELESLASRQEWFQYIPVLLDQEGEDDTGARHEIEILRTSLRDRRDIFPMICGLRSFVNPIRDYFKGIGMDRRAMKCEIYD